MLPRKVLLLLSFFTITAVFLLISASKAPTACAYGQGNCLTQGGDPNDVCYTGTQGPDYAPGYACGDKKGYVYDINPTPADNPSQMLECSSGAGVPDGACCKPGDPKPSLPPHKGYSLGNGCNINSICYTGDRQGNSVVGEQCGKLPDWHYGTTGGASGSVPACGLAGVCCDVGVGTASYVNPCPQDNGICKSIPTAIGDIDVQSPIGFIEKLFALLLSISGGIAVAIFIFSGYRYILSRGDAEKVKNAREAMTSAIVGIIFIVFSLAIMQIITVDIFHLPGFTR